MSLFKLSLKLKNRLEDLDRLNRTLEFLRHRLGMSKKCSCETNLVLEELFTNIIKHGCCDGKTHSINITISLKKEILIIRVEDDGVPFNPIKADQPDRSSPPEDREIGGLGIFLAKHYTEGIEYKRRGRKNILIARKKLIPRSNEESVNGNY